MRFQDGEEETKEEKIHIQKNSVQETLIIPLYGRMKSAEMYPDICEIGRAHV